MSGRGFASMTPERHRELARKGGIAVHAKKTGHEFNSETAKAAGKKGGAIVSQNREHMREIGRKGGLACSSVPGRMAELGKRAHAKSD